MDDDTYLRPHVSIKKIKEQRKLNPESDTFFIKRDHIESKAHRYLHRNSRKLLYAFHQKAKLKTNKDGGIIFTYAEGKKELGLSKKSFARALNELINKGFIDLLHQGGSVKGDYNVYAISQRWEKYGTDDYVLRLRPRKNPGGEPYYSKSPRGKI